MICHDLFVTPTSKELAGVGSGMATKLDFENEGCTVDKWIKQEINLLSMTLD